MNERSTTPVPPRWLHVCAVLTVCATLPLLFLGAEVTTKGAGMADPVGFRGPWELIERLWNEGYASLGLRIEYSHRLAGMVVGLLMIALVIGVWWRDRRWSVRWLSVAALGLVIAQGLLGKYRVDLDGLFHRNLALVHGCFAQIVIATLVCLAVTLSRGWTRDRHDFHAVSPGLRRWSLLTVLLVYLQLVLGGVLRHSDLLGPRGGLLGQRGHLLGAFVVLAAVLWLVKLALDSEPRDSFRRAIVILLALVGLQLVLGVEAWLGRFLVPGSEAAQSTHAHYVRSAHYVVGALVFATTTVVAMIANRRTALAAELAPAHRLEGVA